MTLRSINNSVIFSAERFSAAALLLTAEMTASAIAPLLVALYFSPDIRSLTTAILVVRTAFLAASFVVAIPSLPGFKLALGSIRAARDLLSIGIWFWFAGLIGPLLTYFDRLMIGSVVGVAQLPYYSVPQTMLQQVSHVPRTLGAVLFPRYSAVEDDATADKLTVMAMEAMAFVVTPLIAFLILAMEPLLTVWLSEEFAVNSTLIVSIIMLSLLPSSMARIIASQLNGRGRPDLVVKILLLEAVPYGIALYLLAQSFGLLGVAVAWTLRATVDAFLLAARTNVFFRMFKQLQWPFALITTSIIVGLVWDLGDPRRWIASVVVLLVVSGWCVYRMPPALSRLIDKVPVIRWLPVGSLYKYHA